MTANVDHGTDQGVGVGQYIVVDAGHGRAVNDDQQHGNAR